MLSYAFQVLKQSNYESIAAERFENVQDLFAAILARGTARQVKQGLYREYVTQNEMLSVMRGKLDMSRTILNRIQHKQKLACEFDELSEDNLYNQILKTTMYFLLKDSCVAVERKAAIRKVLCFFDGVSFLERRQSSGADFITSAITGTTRCFSMSVISFWTVCFRRRTKAGIKWRRFRTSIWPVCMNGSF